MNSIYIKNGLVSFFMLWCFISCSEGDDDSPTPPNAVFEPQTELISLTGTSNQLELTWKPVIIAHFIKYQVYRFESYTDAYLNPTLIVNVGELIAESNDPLLSVYVDEAVPLNSFIHYAVVTEYMNENNMLSRVTSVNYLSYENEEVSFMVTSLEQLADGSLKLTWEENAHAGFENYTVAVSNEEGIPSSEAVFTNGTVLSTIASQGTTSIIDGEQYKKNKLSYAVSKVIQGKTIYSKNFLSIENPRSLDFKPIQTLKNPYNANEVIIIGQDGAVVFYNTVTLSSNKVVLNGENFFSSIGAYNDVYDLYVPGVQGKVYIIDLVTHAIKETLQLNPDVGYNIISAIAVNDHVVFLEKHQFADIGGMFVYDRNNQTVINRDGIYSMTANSKLIYGLDNYFFSVWNDGLEYGSVSAIRKMILNGNTVTIDLLFNDSKTDSRLFAISDDKSFFVSTNYGWQSNVDYQNFTETTTEKYSQNQFFGDAKIFENTEIYFALPNEYSITAFEKNNFTAPMNQYTTSGIPKFIEVFENQIISLNQFQNEYYLESIAR